MGKLDQKPRELQIFISSGLLLALLFPTLSVAATLRPETVTAWQDYLQTVNADFQTAFVLEGFSLGAGRSRACCPDARGRDRDRPGLNAQSPKATRRVDPSLDRRGIRTPRQNDDIYQVIRDYDRYKDYYSPSVVGSKLITRSGVQDRFTMQLMNKSFFLSSALDADYLATVVRLDDHRAYSVSHTTRVQQIEDYGCPDERKIPEGEGGAMSGNCGARCDWRKTMAACTSKSKPWL